MREKEMRIKIAKLEERRNHLISKIAVIDDTILNLRELFASKSGIQSHESGLYILQCHDLYKIGYATDLAYRIRDLQVSSPYDLRVVIFIVCEAFEAARLEQSLHKIYSKKNIRGEWFRLSEKDLSNIASLKEAAPDGAVLQYLSRFEDEENAPIQEKIKKIIQLACNESNGSADISLVLEMAKKQGISKGDAENVIRSLRRGGEIFEPRPGFVRLP